MPTRRRGLSYSWQGSPRTSRRKVEFHAHFFGGQNFLTGLSAQTCKYESSLSPQRAAPAANADGEEAEEPGVRGRVASGE